VNAAVKATTVSSVCAQAVITTVAGNGSAAFLGDSGPAAQASLSNPAALAVDAAGNLYIFDSG
jgi:hypothetical protein